MTEATEEIKPELALADPLVAPTYDVIAYPAANLPAQYQNMIFSKWLRGLRYGNPLFKNIDADAFFKEYHRYLENLMSKPDSVIRLAVLSDEPDTALGFSVCREDVCDFIHVHKDQRRVGIAKSLFPPNITTMTHITLTAMDIWRRNDKYKHLIFNPFA